MCYTIRVFAVMFCLLRVSCIASTGDQSAVNVGTIQDSGVLTASKQLINGRHGMTANTRSFHTMATATTLPPCS